jgi:hypothetical protein
VELCEQSGILQVFMDVSHGRDYSPLHIPHLVMLLPSSSDNAHQSAFAVKLEERSADVVWNHKCPMSTISVLARASKDLRYRRRAATTPSLLNNIEP